MHEACSRMVPRSSSVGHPRDVPWNLKAISHMLIVARCLENPSGLGGACQPRSVSCCASQHWTCPSSTQPFAHRAGFLQALPQHQTSTYPLLSDLLLKQLALTHAGPSCRRAAQDVVKHQLQIRLRLSQVSHHCQVRKKNFSAKQDKLITGKCTS